MKIYSFWSADTTYFTKSKNLKKAQTIGKENMEHYLETCEYLGEQPEELENYFIPEEVEVVTKEWFKHLIKVDPDTMILDEELYNI
ncbi:MAG: hypothetical protein LLF98_02275 [Clostridium sp.]|uniref:hypothetical protein n=1 Tax=Clostridium sp. TaxID=1506 RepID=UPI0025BACB3B|nr:hypothetical protein [Clostridium sp.]MCE5220108.1 hypothetical protein [Clostridium sp.]